MRKVLTIAVLIGALQACNFSSDQGGAVNDGKQAVDTNGGLADTAYQYQPQTDTSKLENRVDLSKRDTFNNSVKH